MKVKPNFIKVSHEKGELRIVPRGGFKWAQLQFEDFKGGIIDVSPQLFGKFLVLGVSKEVDSQTARNILELLQGEIPKLYRLRNFLLREPPEAVLRRSPKRSCVGSAWKRLNCIAKMIGTTTESASLMEVMRSVPAGNLRQGLGADT